MKRHTSRNSHRDEKPKPSCNEDCDAVLRASTEEERRRRRRDWMIEQDKLDRHNRLKRKMTMEYEIRRARNMGLPLLEGRCYRPRRSRSESPPSRHRRTSEHYTPKVTLLSKKFGTLNGTMSLFKGTVGTKINPTELCKIKVDIHRNIPGRQAAAELKRDVPNKEDVVLKRRAGEGSKPIFDREEIKRAIIETEEVEERRTVVAVNLENSERKSGTSRRHSVSLSPTRTRSHSPRPTSSRHPRSYRHHRERSIDHSRDRKKTDRYRESPRDRRDRDRPRDQRVVPQNNIEQIPVSIYYGINTFQPKPLMVGPWVPFRGPLGGNLHPPMTRPFRTFPPRAIGIPPNMYGFRPPLNPRFPQMF